MANAVKWEAAPTSRGTGLTTELNSLANNGFSAQGTEFDNSTNLDKTGVFEINLASLNPTGSPYLELHLVQAVGGTNYEDVPSSTNPSPQTVIAVLGLPTGSATKRVTTPPIPLPPSKFRLVLKQATGVSLAASGNTVTLYTDNDEVQ